MISPLSFCHVYDPVFAIMKSKRSTKAVVTIFVVMYEDLLFLFLVFVDTFLEVFTQSIHFTLYLGPF